MNILQPYMSLQTYRSPVEESSIFKGIPIQYYNSKMMKKMVVLCGGKLRVKFRGPRKHNIDRAAYLNRSTCLRKDAVTFAVYYRS